MSIQTIVLAAGKGTRMASPIPKVLIPLNEDKPVIKYLLEEVEKLPQEGKPVIVVGFEKEKVIEVLGPSYVYAIQADQKGTGHAVLCAKDLVTAENFIVLNGDMPLITANSLQKLIEAHEVSQAKISMFTSTVPNFEGVYSHFLAFGRIIRDDSGSIIKIQEYLDCTDEQQQITEINTGEYMFNSEWLWPHLEKIGSHNAQGEIYLTDIVEQSIKDGHNIESLSIVPEEIYGINTPEHLAHAQSLVKK